MDERTPATHHPPTRPHVWLVRSLWLATLLLALPAAAEPKDGQVFENWTVKCEKPKEGNKDTAVQCFIFQNLVLKQGGQRVLNMAVGYPPKMETPVAILTLPLGISLPPGASLKVDDGEPITVPFERCEPAGCRAGIRLEKDLLEGLQKGSKAEVTFHDGAHQPINVPLSLKGFSAGLQALR